MNTEDNNRHTSDAELVRRFAQLRQEDAAQLPPFPSAEELALQKSVVSAARSASPLPKIAAGLAVVLVTGLLVNNRPAQDPGQLYADIMGANRMETDQLLSVSQSELPELYGLPDIIGFGSDAGQIDNIHWID